MTFPPTTSNDPDTTQIAWPQRAGRTNTRQQSSHRSHDSQRSSQLAERDNKSTVRSDSDEIGKKKLSTLDLFNLSISMLGAQVAWTVELGWGTPFLLGLGLSEQLTSLVWLAGPISGLVAQPLIGAISDSSKSRYRRRYWILSSTAVLIVSNLVLAYCREIAAFVVDMFGGGVGDWDPTRKKQVSDTAIGLAVVAFYLLDFALNALQASLRNLLLDVTPPSQLNAGNAWHGRMTHAGNIIGYGFGFLPLEKIPLLALLGGDQFRKFCLVAMIVLVITVLVTAIYQDEKPGDQGFASEESRLADVVRNIWTAIANLPRPIRRVCYVQLFAYMGWFPFLFYATTYVGQVMAKETGEEPDHELATRKGDFALLLFSIVAVLAGSYLPTLARRDTRLLSTEDETTQIQRRGTWQDAQQSKSSKLPRLPFMLRDIWSAAMLLFSVITFSTFFITTVTQATVALSLIGICWAVACWVPFAIIMEFLKEIDDSTKATHANNATVASSSRHIHDVVESDERQALLAHRPGNQEAGNEELTRAPPLAGGTVLGIHNLAIVLPQFIVALVSSFIFRVVDEHENANPEYTYLGRNGVAWILRFGGICALFGALVARMVPPTKSEREMRRKLAEMRALKENGSP